MTSPPEARHTFRMRLASFRWLPWLLCLVGLGACGAVSPSQPRECEEGAQRCTEDLLERCVEGLFTPLMRCTGTTPWCSPELGCYTCQAGSTFCDGDDVRECGTDGTPGDVLEACAEQPHGFCAAGHCTTPCEQAALARSYLGCEYTPTPVINYWLSLTFAMDFGVVVHNPQDVTAHVTITRGEDRWEQDVNGGQNAVFRLPIDTGLLHPTEFRSLQQPNGAYHLVSDLPIAAYQFHPLDYDLSTAEYNTYSYTNDAALLLPAHVLTGNYLVMARATSGVDDDGMGLVMSPGFVTVVAGQDDTHVEVQTSCYVQAGFTATEPIAALSPGDVGVFTLKAGDALQLLSGVPDPATCMGGTLVTDDCNGWDNYTTCDYCDQGPAYDLTGTRITASAPVAVFAGHTCAFVPFDKWACDHLEEQLFPLETWGKEFVVGITEPQSPAGPEPNVVRILAGADDTVVTLSPPPEGQDATALLHEGQWLEFEAAQHVHVSATGPILVGQFLVGQNYNTPDLDLDGDPAFAVQVPVAQYRRSYDFLAPETFPENFVNIIKPVGEQSPVVRLDGAPVPEAAFSAPVGTSVFGVARLPIDGTFHRIEADEPVGILVYGFARYTSYLYPGGLDLKMINPVD